MKKKVALILIVVLGSFTAFFLPVSFDNSSLQNLNGEVMVIGHGGLGFASWIPFNPYPTNSYVALQKAIVEKGADGLEVDVHMTKDRQFILYHDMELDSKTDTKGCITEMNFSEVLATNYVLGVPFDWFQQSKLASLDQVIELLKEQKEIPYLHLDIRSVSKCKSGKENNLWEKKMAYELVEKLKRSGMPKEKVLIISTSKEFVKALHVIDSPFPVSFELSMGSREEMNFAQKYGISSLTLKPSLMSKERSKELHQRGFQVITFGAKSKRGNKTLLQSNPDVIQTNNITALKALLGHKTLAK